MKCENCGKIVWGVDSHSVGNLKVCPNCYKNKFKNDNPEAEIDWRELEKITLTTETNTKDLEIEERLGVISSESALGMNMFRDIFANVRDLVGGQSVSTQKILKDLKSTAFQDIKEQAYKLGADAVVAIDLDYSEFSGSGKSMLFLVATGTAVKLKKEDVTQDQT